MSSRATNADRGGYPVRLKGDSAKLALETQALYHSRARRPKPKTSTGEEMTKTIGAIMRGTCKR
jgi:hypothetical protein